MDAERYGLSWPGRARAGRLALEPPRGGLRPQREASVDFDSTRNVFIEGDNLEVLKLLGRSYHRRVKMIYIDPPYNTGREFLYPDRFQDPQRTHPGARYHTNWLNLMYPRLRLARDLLRGDGVLFASIDDHEVHNLRHLLDEIFGPENFLATITWEKVHTRKNSARGFSVSHEYILAYARAAASWDRLLLPREQSRAYKNPDGDPRGPWKADPITAHNYYSADYRIQTPDGAWLDPPGDRYWVFSEATWARKVAEGRVIWGRPGALPMVKTFLSEVQDGLVPVTLFTRTFAGDTARAKRELDALMGERALFAYPKPVLLLRRLAQIALRPGELAMDFFAGSGTLGQAIYELNAEDGGARRSVLVQLPQPCPPRSAAARAGYATIADLAR